MVDVSNKQNSTVIKVTGSNGNTNITASSDTAQYWSKQSRLSAENSKESAQESKHYAELANSYIEGFEGVVTNNTNNIIATSNDYINQINNTANEANTSINTNKTNAINEINTTKNSAVSSVNTTKTSAITEINNTKTTAVNAVNTSKNEALNAIANAGINDLANKDLSNLTEVGQAKFDAKVDLEDMVAFEMKEVPCIVETYVNGTSGYRLWSDGYCEQWGSTSIQTNGSGTVNFVKPFKDTNYILSLAPSVDSGFENAVYAAYNSITTTSFSCVTSASMGTGNSTVCWRACGYIA